MLKVIKDYISFEVELVFARINSKTATARSQYEMFQIAEASLFTVYLARHGEPWSPFKELLQ